MKVSVTSEDKEWIERNFIWFIGVFGMDHLADTPFILPLESNFPYTDVSDPGQFEKLLVQICGNLGINPDEVEVKVFENLSSMQWSALTLGPYKEAAGYYEQGSHTSKRFTIQIARSNFKNFELLVAVLSHELAHAKLLGGNLVNWNDPDMEALTDLCTIYFGFGVFAANSVLIPDGGWLSKTGYLPNEIISYSNALLCYISGHPADPYLNYFNTNTRSLYKQDYEYLKTTNDTLLYRGKVSETCDLYRLNRLIDECFVKRDFGQAMDVSLQLIRLRPKEPGPYNSLGYACLLQKEYKVAIEAFTKAIELDPHWDVPYNNRGYCYLQLGLMDAAQADLESALNMNPHSSFSWRNLGAYFLMGGNNEKALAHFEEAFKIDPKTELINYYLGKAHDQAGNPERAKYYFNRSADANEYNDSVL